ncbi:hypothetical protein SeMB42_g07755 [Synchytrium endobioticum]|uniref:Uncharacterized protein n=1 Tax=Synchytrium endobioticum TaxID=286115 RepID=A0A507BWF9_9FUNG|nr:hypothetical protein SeMB42_g07755 [Synchytrium endobioticum]
MASRASTVNGPKPTTPATKRPLSSSTATRPASRGYPSKVAHPNASTDNLSSHRTKKSSLPCESLGWPDVDHQSDAIDAAAMLATPALPMDVIKAFNALDVKDCITKMATLVSIPNWRDDLKANIRLCYCHQAYMFARENRFSDPQTSIFFTLKKALLDKCIDRGYTVERTIHIFRAMAMHLLSSSTFDYPQLELITEFVLTSVFQHFRLYKLVLSTDQEQKTLHITLPTAPKLSIPPLNHAITLDIYNAELEAKRKIEQDERAERAKKENDEALARAANPLNPLTEDEIKVLAAQSLSVMLDGMLNHVDHLLKEKEARYLQILAKLQH